MTSDCFYCHYEGRSDSFVYVLCLCRLLRPLACPTLEIYQMDYGWAKVSSMILRSNLLKLDGFGGWHLVVKIIVLSFSVIQAGILAFQVRASSIQSFKLSMSTIKILKMWDFRTEAGIMKVFQSSVVQPNTAREIRIRVFTLGMIVRTNNIT